MSSVFFRHEQNKTVVKAGSKNVVKESIIDGTKGLSFMFLEKKGDDFHKISARQKEGEAVFDVLTKKGDKEDRKDMKEADLMKMVAAEKKLAFVNNYVTKDRKKIIKEKGGGKGSGSGSNCHCPGSNKSYKKRSSKKSTKKSTRKKASKKTSRKKASKKSTKKKASKKTSKKKASRKSR